jgi:hypothetical protein
MLMYQPQEHGPKFGMENNMGINQRELKFFMLMYQPQEHGLKFGIENKGIVRSKLNFYGFCHKNFKNIVVS